MKINKLASTFIIFSLALSPAQAEYIEEIVVTAQKREQSINDVGITVNVFSAQQLADYGVRSVEDLESLTPGLTVSNAQPSGVPTFTIRGVGFSDFTTSSSSTVGLYLDEVNIPFAVMSRGALFDVERVEVLKGPQGDLYGRNTTAGQINFISRKPTEDFAAGITLGYGRFNVIDAEGFVSGTLTDGIRARVAAKTTQSVGDGWQRSISRPDDRLGEREEIALRGLFDVDLGTQAELLLNIHYYDDRSENIAATLFDGTTTGNAQPDLEGGGGGGDALPSQKGITERRIGLPRIARSGIISCLAPLASSRMMPAR